MSTFSEYRPISGRLLHTNVPFRKCKWSVDSGLENSLPACKKPVPHTWLPYMPAGITYVLASHKEVCGLSAKACSCTNLRILLAEARKRTGRMFSRHSHVQGPVENHAQIPKRIFVMKGGTANIKNRNIFTCGVEVHNFGLGSVDN